MKILIISPFFPPNNTPDLQRIRILLPHFIEKGNQIAILRILPKYNEAPIDNFLQKTIPVTVKIFSVKSLNVKLTRKIGLGNIGIRAFYYLLKKGNQIIKQFNPDIIFFSTTVFTILPLGVIWKKKFNIPFVIDMQDPWRNDYYLSRPKNERPPKFFLYYNLNKKLEAYTVPKCNGFVSVNKKYIETLKYRYKESFTAQTLVMPIGAAINDFQLIEKIKIPVPVNYDNQYYSLVYTGVIPDNMLFSIECIFIAVKKYNYINTKKIKLYFIGTNYTPPHLQKPKLNRLIKKYNLQNYVTEQTQRVSYFQAIMLMKKADILLLPGTYDNDYTASKLFPYILSKKIFLLIFNKKSELKHIVQKLTNLPFIGFDDKDNINIIADKVYKTLNTLINNFNYKINWSQFDKFTSKVMADKLLSFFDEIIYKHTK